MATLFYTLLFQSSSTKNRHGINTKTVTNVVIKGASVSFNDELQIRYLE